MIFLKAINWENSRQVIFNLKYIVSMCETDNRRKTTIEILFGKDTYYHHVDRNSIKFIEIKAPEDANGFLSREDVEI